MQTCNEQEGHISLVSDPLTTVDMQVDKEINGAHNFL